MQRYKVKDAEITKFANKMTEDLMPFDENKKNLIVFNNTIKDRIIVESVIIAILNSIIYQGSDIMSSINTGLEVISIIVPEAIESSDTFDYDDTVEKTRNFLTSKQFPSN